MEKLISGIHRFESQVFRYNREFFARLSTGQNPQALFITCSDSRMVPDLITQSDPGDLFVLRNAGNLVPSYGHGSGAEAAASVGHIETHAGEAFERALEVAHRQDGSHRD